MEITTPPIRSSGRSGSLSDGAIFAGDLDTFDAARIEVLRGPQGTPYGSNSLGGVFKFIAAEPNTREFGLRGQAGGAEVTATFGPLRGLRVIASAAYNDAELRDDTTTVQGATNLTGGLAGDEPPFSPKVTGNLSAHDEWSLSDSVEAFVVGNIRAIDDQTAGFSSAYRTAFARRIKIDNYETVGLRAGVIVGAEF